MPPLPTIENTLRVTFNWLNTETVTTAHNVAHFQGETGSESDCFGAIESNFDQDQISAMSSNTIWTGCDIIALDGGSASVHFETDHSIIGGGGTSPVPALCAVVSMATGTRGPQGRGRLFLPFMGEEQCEAGRISDASLAAMNAQWEGFRDDMATAEHNMLVASYVHEVSRIVSSITVKQLCGTQRRRQDALR